jgi:hypothetical protein
MRGLAQCLRGAWHQSLIWRHASEKHPLGEISSHLFFCHEPLNFSATWSPCLWWAPGKINNFVFKKTKIKNLKFDHF